MKLRFVEWTILWAFVLTTIWMFSQYWGFLFTTVIMVVALGTIGISYLVELIDPSKVSQTYFKVIWSIIAGCFFTLLLFLSLFDVFEILDI